MVVLLLALAVRRGAAADPANPGKDAAADASNGVVYRAFDHFVVKGGWITWFTLIPLSLAAMALAIEHAVSIRRKTIIPAESVQRLTELIDQRQYGEAVQFSVADRSVISYVTNAGLVEASHGYGAMERAVEEAVEDRTARLMRKIEYLNVIGNVAPMLGLFGTIYGMIGMFVSISETGGIPVAARVAEDLGVALVTTFWGLLIAIPSLSVFALFRNRIDVLMAECAVVSDRLLGVFKPQVAEASRPATSFGGPVGALAGVR
ncbi:MAG TPA: MotA/TolQ/ExbB proton channel family protein [Phycisphaerae bacterium]|jgi:biopolymer transport protein ExbB